MALTRAHQSSESLVLAVLLALSGGIMDAYSYLGRDHVFANAQTGNILLSGLYLASGEFDHLFAHALPVGCFAIGLVLSYIARQLDARLPIHWRQALLVVEALVLFGVACIPSSYNLLANSITSAACGMQVQAFRRVHGRPFVTTMCVGNLRSGTEALLAWIHHRDTRRLHDAAFYAMTIGFFVIGAVIGARVLSVLGLRTIILCPVLLAGAFVIMRTDREAPRTRKSSAA